MMFLISGASFSRIRRGTSRLLAARIAPPRMRRISPSFCRAARSRRSVDSLIYRALDRV